MSALVKYDLTKFGMDKEQVQLIKDQIAKQASDAELAMFLSQCQRTQLDPFSRQIYCIGRYDSKLGREVYTTQISIDGARLVAERSNKYEGQDGPYWCGEDGVWRDVWLDRDPPLAAKVGVYRSGFQKPLYAVANWDSYVQMFKSKQTQKWEVSQMWAKFPALMLGKVAEMLALRRAFPMELSGLYSSEEMASTEKAEVIDAPQLVKAKSEPAETQQYDAVFTGAADDLKMFFAAMEKKGFPQVAENAEFLRSVFKACKGRSLHELDDIMAKAIAERSAK